MRLNNKGYFFQLMLLAGGGAVLLFIVAPLVGMFLNCSGSELLATAKELEIRKSIWMTLGVSACGTLLFALPAIPFAYLLARKNFPFKRLVTGLVDLPVVIPHSAAGIALLGVLSRDTALGKMAESLGFSFVGSPAGIMVAMAFVSLPFLINSARNGFAAVPEKLEKTALTLGASPFRVFRTVSLPLASRSILSGLIMMWARGLSEFGAVIIIAYHPMTTPVMIFERFGAFGLKYARPVAVLFILVCLAIFILLRLVSESRAGLNLRAFRRRRPANRPSSPAPDFVPQRPAETIEIRNLSKTFDDVVLRQIDFSVQAGDYFVLLGESGAGKSVLLETIAGLIEPSGGSIRFGDRDITADPVQQRGIGLVYQDQSLFPHLDVFENIAYPLHSQKMSTAEIDVEVRRLAEKTGVTHLLDRDASALSLGEAQRTALARTLATRPRLLLLDEPMASLDVQAKARMRTLLRKLNADGQTIIHVTHVYEEAIALADQLGIIEEGTLVQTGAPETVFQHPTSRFAARFSGVKNFYRGTLEHIGGDLARFRTGGVDMELETDASEGTGCMILRSQEVFLSPAQPESSARNYFRGTITDIEPVRLGVEVHVDIGVPMVAHITTESRHALNLQIGQGIGLGFKASAPTYLENAE